MRQAIVCGRGRLKLDRHSQQVKPHLYPSGDVMAAQSGNSRRYHTGHGPGATQHVANGTTDDDPMMVLNWYHPHLSRHAADSMLLETAPEGCYLLRPSKNGDYALSIKLSSSVQHVKVTKTLSGAGYKFGNCTFHSLESFKRHCELEKPVIGGDSGITVVLRFPFSRFIDDTHQYTDVVHHAVSKMVDSETEDDTESNDSIKEGLFFDSETGKEVNLAQQLTFASREGYLTKLGQIRKSWRVRWFVLKNTTLTYYKTKQSPRPIKSLSMTEAIAVEYDNTKKKDFCFRIDFPSRSLYVYANSIEDCQQWVELLEPLTKSRASSSVREDNL